MVAFQALKPRYRPCGSKARNQAGTQVLKNPEIGLNLFRGL